jgi:hypothetical protein
MSTELLAAVKRAAGKVARAEAALEKARTGLTDAVVTAVDAGCASVEVARVAGVTPARVSQLAPVPKAVPAPIHAQKNGAEAMRADETDDVPTLAATGGDTLSGVASVRQRRRYGSPTLFLDTRTAPKLSDVLRRLVGQPEVARVYLCGPAPMDASTGATKAEQVRAWAMAYPGEGWTLESLYLSNPALPVVRLTGPGGRRVVIHRAASWWGESDADAETCRRAWVGLEAALNQVPSFAGAGLADTPATTGRALWLRTIPEGKAYPVLSAELRELIGTTSGQGRIELRPPAPSVRRRTLDEGVQGVGERGSRMGQDFTYLDGRFFYAGLTWGMPIGEPRRITGADVDTMSAREFTAAVRGRGRWRVTVTVPAGWEHVGMLAAPADGGGWRYPCRPGERFTTWVDGSELWSAMEYGWDAGLVIHEGIVWDEGKPLDLWRNALVSVWEAAQRTPGPAAALGAKAVRSILLYGLGAFATRAHPVTRTAPVSEAGLVPAGAEVRVIGEQLVWTELEPLRPWSEAVSHPEWSATVWARARTRLLTGRGVGQERIGALHLPADRIVAFATDALYLAGGDPGWADDGKPGRFRSKGTRPGPFAWPTSYADLYTLRDEAEAHR